MMKKFLSILLVVCMSMTCVVGKKNVVQAKEMSNYYVAYDTNGNITDYNMPISQEEFEAKMKNRYTETTALTSGSMNWVDLGYHQSTDIWRRVSAYYFSVSKTYSTSVEANFNYQGKNFSVGGSIGIAKGSTVETSYSVDADQSRDSKIRVYVDYDWTYYEGREYDNYSGNLQYTYNFTVFTKTAERFIPEYR